MENDLAPIVLFVYNRPLHTLKTLEALSKNEFANESLLFIYCDGPKSKASDEEIKKIKEVRELVKRENWCKEVKIIEAENNKGLANSIINGVTEIVGKYGKIIVLEDDLETSPGFLKFMNQALMVYEAEPEVMHISGYMFPVKRKLPPTFFYNTCSCWGWGTWKRAWDKLQTDPLELYEQLKGKGLLSKFTIEGTADFEEQLMLNIQKKKYTWAVKWYASLLLNGGYSLHPYPSLVNNVGHDSSGENCGVNNIFHWEKLATNITVSKIPITESKEARKEMAKFYKGKSKGFVNVLKDAMPSTLKLALKKILIKHERQAFLMKRRQSNELKKLQKIPRFMELQTGILGNSIKVPDSASFVFIFKEIFFEHIYKFRTNCSNPRIIDCGANIGLSVLYFKKMFPGSIITAFEPDEKLFDTLKSNVEAFQFDNVCLINKGLWKEDGRLSFISEGADGGKINFNSEPSTHSIAVTRLSNYLNQKIDFLKIDIEGAEFDVLEECKDKLENVQRIFLEYHSFIGQEQKLDKILAVLKESGFRIYISSPGLHSKNPFEEINTYNGMDLQLNIFGIRNESSSY